MERAAANPGRDWTVADQVKARVVAGLQDVCGEVASHQKVQIQDARGKIISQRGVVTVDVEIPVPFMPQPYVCKLMVPQHALKDIPIGSKVRIVLETLEEVKPDTPAQPKAQPRPERTKARPQSKGNRKPSAASAPAEGEAAPEEAAS